jgi:prefoldin subunit 5
MGNSMIETIDLISKKAAMKGLESSIELYMKRIEALSAQYTDLGDEISQLEKPAEMIQA